MDQAVEFLSGPGVLVLRLYEQPAGSEMTRAAYNVTRHGCYNPGVPLLLDVTQVDAWEVATDLAFLRSALTAALPGSPLAVVVPPTAHVPDESSSDVRLFTSRADALQWLTIPWNQATVGAVPRIRATRS